MICVFFIIPSFVYTIHKFYYRSKLYPVMSMLNLQRQLQEDDANVNCYAVHPGLVPTDLWYSGGGPIVGYCGEKVKRLLRVSRYHF